MKKIAIALGVLVLLGAGAWAIRLPLMLRMLGVYTDFTHPRAANRPVPWQEGPAVAAAPAGQRPPNVVVILADDLGFNDVSLYGGGIPQQPTPNIDAIAARGARFDRGYSANAVCAPSRATLLTGRYSSRFGFEFTPTPGNMARVAPLLDGDEPRAHEIITHPENAERIGPFETLGLPPSEVTIAEVLKARGYHTVHIGKWHLGSTPELRPGNQGFDESLFMESGLYLPESDPDAVNAKQDFDPIDRFLWANMRYATSYNGGEWFEPRGYLTDYYTDEAVRAIHANRNRPFFLYLAHWAVHTPLQALRSDYDALADIPLHRRRVSAAMVRALDRSVGRVMRALEDEGIADDTLVVFSSDNGAPGYIGLPEVNRPFRGWKLTYFEGGMHVALAAAWPKRIPAGTVYREMVSSVDLLPTIAAAAGAAPPDDRPIDGVNLLPYLAGERTGAPHDVLFWRDGTYEAVIARGWKLQRAKRPARTWLHHIDEDPTEQTELSAREPAKVAELAALLDAHGARMAPPMWPSFIEMPIAIDHTLAEPDRADDEVIYWQN